MAQAKTMQAASEVRFNRFMAGVYLVMALGLAVTAFVALRVSAAMRHLMLRILTDGWFVFGLFILQIILVGVLSAAVMRLSPFVAFLLFLLYSGFTWLMISVFLFYYCHVVISYTFWVTAGMFLFASIVGLFIKRDLSGLGMFLMLALAGWLFGYMFTIFFSTSAGFDRGMNFLGILLFAGLTVLDTNRLKKLSSDLEGKQGMGEIIVIGALALYLDFINLFLLLLRTSRR